MEKIKPHYSMVAIEQAYCDPFHLNRSFVPEQGADDLNLDDGDFVDVIPGLSRADFEKSMTSYADHRVWQDIYKPKIRGKELYVKFTLDAQQSLLLISFKEA